MNLDATRARLVAVTRELAARWQETREDWRDAKCQEFEARYLTNLFASVERAAAALEQLNELVKKVRKDCE